MRRRVRDWSASASSYAGPPGRVKPGTDLYSRKVLIEAGSGVLPEWLRFVSGVVDSEDIPLNISRETMQDSALLKRLRAVLTRRVLRFFDAEARKDAETYNSRFFPEFVELEDAA